MPKYLTQDYITLKNHYKIQDSYPFDDENQSDNSQNASTKNLLNCKMDHFRFPSIMTFKVDFSAIQSVQEVKFIVNFKKDYEFKQGSKLTIRIAAADISSGSMKDVLVIVFDQD